MITNIVKVFVLILCTCQPSIFADLSVSLQFIIPKTHQLTNHTFTGGPYIGNYEDVIAITKAPQRK